MRNRPNTVASVLARLKNLAKKHSLLAVVRGLRSFFGEILGRWRV